MRQKLAKLVPQLATVKPIASIMKLDFAVIANKATLEMGNPVNQLVKLKNNCFIYL